MREAVESARDHAQRGEVVVLAPACASFGLFASYAERGEAFVELVTGETDRRRSV